MIKLETNVFLPGTPDPNTPTGGVMEVAELTADSVQSAIMQVGESNGWVPYPETKMIAFTHSGDYVFFTMEVLPNEEYNHSFLTGYGRILPHDTH